MGCCPTLRFWSKRPLGPTDADSAAEPTQSAPLNNQAPSHHQSHSSNTFKAAQFFMLIMQSQRFKNEAYERLSEEEPKLVGQYERTLQNLSSTSLSSPGSQEQQDPGLMKPTNDKTTRVQLMNEAIRLGLIRTEKEAKVKKRIGESVRMFDSIKHIVDTAVKVSPEASLAWAPVCLTMEILSNPIKQSSAQREGLEHILKRIRWYFALTDSLSSPDGETQGTGTLQEELRKKITDLYMSLLSYQMRSVNVYHQNRVFTSLADFISYDNWDVKLQDVKDLETDFQKDFDLYKREVFDNAVLKFIERINKSSDQAEFNKCKDLVAKTVPDITRQQIIHKNGELLETCCDWFFKREDFRKWQHGSEQRVLWINGSPGKGKTMLLCALIEWFKSNCGLAYFFCVATDSSVNYQAAVLRGLIYTIITNVPGLVDHIRKNEDALKLENEASVEMALFSTLKSIIEDPQMNGCILLIDALDECQRDIGKILELVKSTPTSKVKWILSSRGDLTAIPRQLGNEVLPIGLDDNIPSNAVGKFVQHRLATFDTVWGGEKPSKEILEGIEDDLMRKASGTYLNAVLVLSEIERQLPDKDPTCSVEKFVRCIIQNTPEGLDRMYEDMMKKINKQEEHSELYKDVLKIVSTTIRPLALRELQRLVKEAPSSIDDLREILWRCGSFLSVQNDTITFIHQSAKDFVSDPAESSGVLSNKSNRDHWDVFSRSMIIMSDCLKRDISGIDHPEQSKDITKCNDPDPLAPAVYCCVNWVHHLMKSNCATDPKAHESVRRFFNQDFLHWLEALGLLGESSAGGKALQKLRDWADDCQSHEVKSLIHDAYLFFLKFRAPLEVAPLQAYVSGLIFSPSRSMIKKAYQQESPKWVTLASGIETHRSPCSLTLEHSDQFISDVVFWDDNQTLSILATFLKDRREYAIVTVWDASTGDRLREVRTLKDLDISSKMSKDGRKWAWVSGAQLIEVWDQGTENPRTAESDSVSELALSSNGQYLATASYSSSASSSSSSEFVLTVYDTLKGSGAPNQLFRQCLIRCDEERDCIAFVSDELLASSSETTIYIDDIEGILRGTLQAIGNVRLLRACDGNPSRLVSLANNTVQVWDVRQLECLQTIQSCWPDSDDETICLSEDGSRLAVLQGTGGKSTDNSVFEIQIWDLDRRMECVKFDSQGFHDNLTFSKSHQQLASVQLDTKHIAIWELAHGTLLVVLKGQSDYIRSLSFSHDNRQLASACDGDAMVWELGPNHESLDNKVEDIYALGDSNVAFSPSGEIICSRGGDGVLKLWDISQRGLGAPQAATGRKVSTWTPVFSSDGRKLAVSCQDGQIEIWGVSRSAPQCLLNIHGSSKHFASSTMEFSEDGTLLASGGDSDLFVWDMNNGDPVFHQDFKTGVGFNLVHSIAFFQGNDELAVSTTDGKILVFDISTKAYKPLHAQAACPWVLATIVSGGSEFLLSGANDTIKLWEVGNREDVTCIRTIEVQGHINQLLRDPTDKYIFYTNLGVLDLGKGFLNTLVSGEELETPSLRGYGLSFDNAWVTKDGKNIMWLPPEYRPRDMDGVTIWRTHMAIARQSGRWFILYLS
ncbi:WD domain-containing [Fusarium albosuccineum]|uniref:WD domain-containing n=1 Tax=Fusarium albosuccineum TaxID=1237068 RepID=A0A8H4LJJ7_9HYPO|nr:WD domain-containing [Fusarium albosuccineum]